jgi:N-acetylneuraminate synthase
MRAKRSTIIAEAGVNHDGSIELAEKMVEVAVTSGADIVKFQTFKADAIVTRRAEKAGYQKDTTGAQQTQYDMLKKLELNPQDYFRLAELCRRSGIEFLSTAFDEDSLSFLVNEVGINRIKVPSGELTNAPLLLNMARFQKPIILSTGMASLSEIEQALGVLAFGLLDCEAKPCVDEFFAAYASEDGHMALKKHVTILQCTSEYPTDPSSANLNMMPLLGQIFDLPYGYSDHTVGIGVAIAARALGATIIEKHFTLNKNLPGPDHRASLDPGELCNMVRGIRQAESALNGSRKVPSVTELQNRVAARRSIVASRDIDSGESFSPNNLTLKRPGDGKSPYEYWDLLGRSASRPVKKDHPVDEASNLP